MDQSRPRHTAVKPISYSKLKSPLIERPDLQSGHQKTLYGTLTLAFWALWIYLWLPLLALFAWGLGFQQAFKYMVKLNGYQDVLRLLGVYASVILFLGGTLILWAGYNIFRFRGIERRAGKSNVTTFEISQFFGQNIEAVDSWQNKQRMSVIHDALGNVERVNILS